MTKHLSHKYSRILGCSIALFFLILLAKNAFEIIRFSNRGLDFTDESFYLLSYATRDELGRSFTGATWLIGSAYDVLGQDVSRLRVAKLIALVCTGGILGWQVHFWVIKNAIQNNVNKYLDFWGWKLSFIFAGSLGALAPYSWTPATPSYNDLNLIVLLLICALGLNLCCENEFKLSKRLAIKFLLLGALLGAESFVKLSSAVVVFVLILPLLLKFHTNIVNSLKILLSLLVGFMLFWAITNVFIVNIFQAMPNSLSVLRVIAQDGYDPATLLRGYFSQLMSATLLILKTNIIPLAILFLAPIVSYKCSRRAQTSIVVFSILLACYFLTFETYLVGGANAIVKEGRLFVIALLIFSIFSLAGHQTASYLFTNSPKHFKLAFKNLRLPKSYNFDFLKTRPAIIPIWLLLLAPFVQAVGTLNDILTGASFSNITWIFTIVIVATYFPLMFSARITIFMFAIFGIWGMQYRSMDGFLNFPYRLIESPRKMDSQVSGLDRIGSMRLDTRSAEYFIILRDIFERENVRETPTILGFNDLPGEVFVLGGISPGEPWYFNSSEKRNLNNIQYSCLHNQIRKEDPPIILTNQDISIVLQAELATCGINFPEDYKFAGEAISPLTGLATRVYVPE